MTKTQPQEGFYSDYNSEFPLSQIFYVVIVNKVSLGHVSGELYRTLDPVQAQSFVLLGVAANLVG